MRAGCRGGSAHIRSPACWVRISLEVGGRAARSTIAERAGRDPGGSSTSAFSSVVDHRVHRPWDEVGTAASIEAWPPSVQRTTNVAQSGELALGRTAELQLRLRVPVVECSSGLSYGGEHHSSAGEEVDLLRASELVHEAGCERGRLDSGAYDFSFMREALRLQRAIHQRQLAEVPCRSRRHHVCHRTCSMQTVPRSKLGFADQASAGPDVEPLATHAIRVAVPAPSPSVG